jgi:hypothetical protein
MGSRSIAGLSETVRAFYEEHERWHGPPLAIYVAAGVSLLVSRATAIGGAVACDVRTRRPYVVDHAGRPVEDDDLRRLGYCAPPTDGDIGYATVVYDRHFDVRLRDLVEARDDAGLAAHLALCARMSPEMRAFYRLLRRRAEEERDAHPLPRQLLPDD